MKLEVAQRRQAKIKLGLQGCSGSGKTTGALLIAYGLCDGRTLPGRRRTGARLSRAAGADGGAVCAGPVQRGGWRTALPHGRRGALSGQWRAGVPGAVGPAGEAAGLPH